MDIRELLIHLRAGHSHRQIQQDLSIDRRTVKRYSEWAHQQGLLQGDLPPLEALQALREKTLPLSLPPQNSSSVEPYRAVVEKLLKEQVEIAAIKNRLAEQGFTGSYSAVHRFVRRLQPRCPEATVRVERPPGQEAQIDFGSAGKLIDPVTHQLRRSWVFVMLLSWSRHQYVEFVFDQKLETWLTLHVHALDFFGGVPNRLVIDNLKAAILRAVQDDPQVQQSYRECAEHYGFLIAPCRVATPEHKGKVEQGGVHYVKRNFLAGREPTSIIQANQDVLHWCNTTAGLRIHGTTKEQPLVRFQETEQERLKPLPTSPYDLAVWKQVKLHRDCYLVFEGSYYSAPHRLIGQVLWVRGGLKQVRILTADYRLVATHQRAQAPGERLTHPDHLPAYKLPGLTLNRDSCLAMAQQIGPATLKVVESLLEDPLIDRLPSVIRLLKLRQRFSDQRLEKACQRAWHFTDPTYKTVKRILTQGLEEQPLSVPKPTAGATTFVRSAQELVGHLSGGESWN